MEVTVDRQLGQTLPGHIGGKLGANLRISIDGRSDFTRSYESINMNPYQYLCR